MTLDLSNLKSRDLVGLLLAIGSRTWRQAQPVVIIRLWYEVRPC